MKKERKTEKKNQYLRDNSFRNCSISLLFSAYIAAKRFNSASTFSDAAWMVWYSFFSGAVNATKQQDIYTNTHTIVSNRLKQNKQDCNDDSSSTSFVDHQRQCSSSVGIAFNATLFQQRSEWRRDRVWEHNVLYSLSNHWFACGRWLVDWRKITIIFFFKKTVQNNDRKVFCFLFWFVFFPKQ